MGAQRSSESCSRFHSKQLSLPSQGRCHEKPKPCGWRWLCLVYVQLQPHSKPNNESCASDRTSPSGHMMRLFCTLGRAGPRERGSKQRRRPHSNCILPQAPGSWPGPVTHGRGDAVPWCPSSTQLGRVCWVSSLPETRWLFPFYANQMWGTSLCRAEATPGGPSSPASSLAPGEGVAQPPPLSPARLTPTSHSFWAASVSSLPTNRK